LQIHPVLAHSPSIRTSHRTQPGRPNPGPEDAAAFADGTELCRVLIAERDPMSGDLLAGALSRESWCRASAVDAIDLLPSLSAGSADLVVVSGELDPRGQSGFNLAQSVLRGFPSVPVVTILARSTPNSVLSAFRSGARGVVSREHPIALFLQCIDNVRRGLIWAGGKEADILLDVIRNLPAPSLMGSDPASPLTARELQIVRGAAAGKTNKVIAQELNLSEHTVKNYLFRIFEKLGVTSRIELLFYLTFRGHALGAPVVVEYDAKVQTPSDSQKRAMEVERSHTTPSVATFGNIA
jgi:two-component system nitrate/nitrite response regulator NarL